LKRLWAGLSVVVLALAMSASARAQVGIYAMFSGGYLSTVTAQSGPLTLSTQSVSAYGGTFGAYYNRYKLGPLRLGADGRFFIDSSTNGNNVYGNKLHGGLAGARLALVAREVPFSPFIQAEIGGVGTNYGTQSSSTTSFAYQINGGLDYTIIPRLDARAEYGTGEISSPYNGVSQTMQEFGIGLVLRLK
jgi:opacity protein-like surface antigen